MVDISIIIVSYNTKKLLLDCLASIKKFTKGVSYEVIVVDNASTDGSVEAISSFQFPVSSFQLIKNKTNLGFAKANNQGIKRAQGRYILLLNSDTKLLEDSLTKMVKWMDQNSKVGALTCALVGPDGSLQPNGGSFPSLLRVLLWATFLDDIPGLGRVLGSYHGSVAVPISKYIYNRPHQKDWISGAAFLIRKEVARKVGGMDENFFMYEEDVEYCFRIKQAGWEIWYIPTTKILHVGFASSGGGVVRFAGTSIGKTKGITGEFEGLKKFFKKHYPVWQYSILRVLLKLAAFLRIIVFGILGGQREAREAYAKALATT